MDPSDQATIEMNFSDINPALSLLSTGETISTYTLALDADSIALGVEIGTGAYAPELINDATSLRAYISVAEAKREDPAFAGGFQACVIATITTNSAPARRYQRTFVVTIQQH